MAHGDITHIEIPVSDIGGGTRFYSELFGWGIEAVPGFEEYPMWQAPNQVSGGALTPREETFTQPRAFVEVDSIDTTLTHARELGSAVLIEKEPAGDMGWYAVVVDPDGNQIGLFENAPSAA